MRFDEFLDEGPLDLRVLLLDRPDGVLKLTCRKLLRNQLQLLNYVGGLMQPRSEYSNMIIKKKKKINDDT